MDSVVFVKKLMCCTGKNLVYCIYWIKRPILKKWPPLIRAHPTVEKYNKHPPCPTLPKQNWGVQKSIDLSEIGLNVVD